MLDDVDPSGFDLIAALGYPLPVTVICELLGVPAEDQHLFGPWSSDASRMLDGDLDDATIQRGLLAFMSARQLPQRHLRGAPGRPRATTSSPRCWPPRRRATGSPRRSCAPPSCCCSSPATRPP